MKEERKKKEERRKKEEGRKEEGRKKDERRKKEEGRKEEKKNIRTEHQSECLITVSANKGRHAPSYYGLSLACQEFFARTTMRSR